MTTRKRLKPRPRGLPWLSPLLVVCQVKKAIRLYEKAFGFQRRTIVNGSDGKPVHAEIEYRNMVVMLARESTDRKFLSPSKLGGSPVHLYVYVDDVDNHYRTVKRYKDVEIEGPPEDQVWGDRIYSVRDPEGHVWTFATRVRKVGDDELIRDVQGLQDRPDRPDGES